jgi:hypothetical protein
MSITTADFDRAWEARRAIPDRFAHIDRATAAVNP